MVLPRVAVSGRSPNEALVAFRKATSADLSAIVRLLADDELGRSREAAGVPPDSRYREAFAAIDKDPNQLLIVGTSDEAVVSCLQLSFIPGLSRHGAWRGQIEGVRVARAARGNGIGEAMIQRALSESRKRGCTLVQLTTDKSRSDALRFYQDLGFEATHEGMKRTI